MSVAADLLRTFEAEGSEAEEHHHDVPLDADIDENAHASGESGSRVAGTNTAYGSPHLKTVV